MYYIHELRSTPEAPHVSRATSQQYLLRQALTDRRAGRAHPGTWLSRWSARSRGLARVRPQTIELTTTGS
jgi:hypothetical protein